MQQTYLGSEPWIFEGLEEAFAETEAEYKSIRGPALFPEPRNGRVFYTPENQKRRCPEETRIPDTVVREINFGPSETHDDMFDIKPGFKWRAAFRVSERLLEQANLRQMMRPCPATRLARIRALQNWKQVKKAAYIARLNNRFYI